MKFWSAKKIKWLIVASLIICSLIIAKVILKFSNDVKTYKLQLGEVVKEKDYWEKRYVRTLEGRFDRQIARELGIQNREIEFLEVGKNFEGFLTVNHLGTEKDYHFVLKFDRNGLPLVTNLIPRSL